MLAIDDYVHCQPPFQIQILSGLSCDWDEGYEHEWVPDWQPWSCCGSPTRFENCVLSSDNMIKVVNSKHWKCFWLMRSNSNCKLSIDNRNGVVDWKTGKYCRSTTRFEKGVLSIDNIDNVVNWQPCQCCRLTTRNFHIVRYILTTYLGLFIENRFHVVHCQPPFQVWTFFCVSSHWEEGTNTSGSQIDNLDHVVDREQALKIACCWSTTSRRLWTDNVVKVVDRQQVILISTCWLTTGMGSCIDKPVNVGVW